MTTTAKAVRLLYVIDNHVKTSIRLTYGMNVNTKQAVRMPYDLTANQPPASSAYRYWRIFMPGYSNTVISFLEIEMRASVGGVDQCNGGTANASHADTNAIKAFDNETSNNYWVASIVAGSDVWIKYGLGAGQSMSVGELAILCRYANQVPNNFTLQASADGNLWTDIQTWSNITGWANWTWKYFQVTPSVQYTKRSVRLPWDLLIAAKTSITLPYQLGFPVAKTVRLPWSWGVAMSARLRYGVATGLSLRMPYGASADKTSRIRYAIQCGRSVRIPYKIQIGISVRILLPCTTSRMVRLSYALLTPRKKSVRLCYDACDRRARSVRVSYDILAYNPTRKTSRLAWEILGAESSTLFMSADVVLVRNGARVPLAAAEIGISEGEYAWVGRAEIARVSDFLSITVNDEMVLIMGEQRFVVTVQSRTITRSQSGNSMTVTLISPTVALTFPRATPVDLSGDQPILASSAVSGAVGRSVSWDMLDWTIPVGRMAFHQASPMDIAKTVVSAAGGVVETLPDGTLRTRHRFPVRVPDWGVVQPDHILTDRSIISISESYLFLNRVNRVTVRDWQPSSSGRLSIEPDDRPDGLNPGGAVSYLPGSSMHVLVHAGSGVSGVELKASVGTLWPDPPQRYQEKVDLVFSDADTVTLPRPVESINEWIWMGTSLGDLTLSGDGVTVRSAESGLSVARVTVTVAAYAWKLIAPRQVGGQTRFPIVLVATATDGDPSTEGEVTAQRGDGAYQGADIVEPLAATLECKRERARAEIDAGESLQNIEITCIFNADILPGHLVDVQDALMGRSWRGQVTSVHHAANGATLFTDLDLLRQVGDIS
ncbi:MAG: discoidin domain-containing protein [Magnetococcus sp. YQC-5]